MAQKMNERTLQMMNNYVQLWKEGYSVKEIANKFGLTPFTVYNRLEAIAQESGYSREELLQRPHKEHLPHERRFEYVKPVDSEAIRTRFLSAIEDVSIIRALVEESTTEEEDL